MLFIVPPLLKTMVDDSDFDRTLVDPIKIVICGGAPIGSTILKKFFDKFGSDKMLIEGYGSTEAAGGTHSQGVAKSNIYNKIVNLQTGKTLGPDEGEGELCTKGPQVMKGYHRNEKATNDTLIDGWFHTGDIAKVDKDLTFTIVDRLQEIIKVTVKDQEALLSFVAPAELENLIRLHPSVEDVAVTGIPEEDGNSWELPKAFVVLSKGYKEDAEDIKAFVAERVAVYKRLEGGVEFVKEIPKSASGKILRRMLKDL